MYLKFHRAVVSPGASWALSFFTFTRTRRVGPWGLLNPEKRSAGTSQVTADSILWNLAIITVINPANLPI